eukprot:1353137-Pleurochrysis_carterae.AAC.1
MEDDSPSSYRVAHGVEQMPSIPDSPRALFACFSIYTPRFKRTDPRHADADASTSFTPSTTPSADVTVRSTHPSNWPDASPVDLLVASSARALMTTRNARTAGHHSRHLPPRSKHIAFVIDSGCTHHIHPCETDLLNAVP